MSVFQKQCFSTYAKKDISVHATACRPLQSQLHRDYLLQITKVINVPVVQPMFLGAARSAAAQLVGLRKAFTSTTNE